MKIQYAPLPYGLRLCAGCGCRGLGGHYLSQGAIPAVRTPFDIISFGFPGANRIHELAFDAGYVGIEYPLGFGAEGHKCVFAEFGVIEAGFVGVDVP